MKWNDLPTPSPLLDLARLKRNAERMRNVAARTGVTLRPHVKTHKCPEVARLQHGGVVGPITVSTLAEAEGFAAAGFTDMTYAVPIEPGKFLRALDLARRVGLRVVTDDASSARSLARAAGAARLRPPVLLEIDCGDHRCGVDPEDPASIDLARMIATSPSLDFEGVITHAGHSYQAVSHEAVAAVARQEQEIAASFAERLIGEGIPVRTVSIGSTPTMTHAGELRGVTEIRPGNTIFFDVFQALHGSCAIEDCALSVLTAVVHADVRARRIVVDAGAVALSKDLGPRDVDAESGYGRVLWPDGRDSGARVTGVTQEHGEIDLPPPLDAGAFPVGARLRILPNHACLTAAQHAAYYVVEDTEVVATWPTVRGW